MRVYNYTLIMSSKDKKEKPEKPKKKQLEDCPVCIEPYTAVIRKKTSCPKCHQEACLVCFKRYITESIDEPHCMNCKFGFTRTFLYNTVTKKFMNDEYIKKRGDILWSREESYIHEAVQYAEIYKRYKECMVILETDEMKKSEETKKLLRDQVAFNRFRRQFMYYYYHYPDSREHIINKLNGTDDLSTVNKQYPITTICYDYNCLVTSRFINMKNRVCDYVNEVHTHSKTLLTKTEKEKYIKEKLNAYDTSIIPDDSYINNIKYKRMFNRATDIINGRVPVTYTYQIYDETDPRYILTYYSETNGPVEPKKENERKYIRKCPSDKCNGFLSTAWKCEICDKYTCKDCLVVVGCHDQKEKHKCNTDDLETAKMIQADSKPCPNCGEYIQRSEGCSQMFCTLCHTGFDWTTLKIIKNERIHNPHYFEWLNKNGRIANLREVGDLPCGGVPYIHTGNRIFNCIKEVNGVLKDLYKLFTNEFVPLLLDIHGRIIPLYRTDMQFNNNLMRIQFMNGDITKDKYKSVLQGREKEREFNYEIRSIFDTFMAVMIEYVTIYNNTIRDYTVDKCEETVRIQKEQLALIMEFSTFINNQMEEISYYYSMSVPIINTDTWRVMNKKVTRKDALVSTKDSVVAGVKKKKATRTKKAIKNESSINEIFELSGSESDSDLNVLDDLNDFDDFDDFENITEPDKQDLFETTKDKNEFVTLR